MSVHAVSTNVLEYSTNALGGFTNVLGFAKSVLGFAKSVLGFSTNVLGLATNVLEVTKNVHGNTTNVLGIATNEKNGLIPRNLAKLPGVPGVVLGSANRKHAGVHRRTIRLLWTLQTLTPPNSRIARRSGFFVLAMFLAPNTFGSPIPPSFPCQTPEEFAHHLCRPLDAMSPIGEPHPGFVLETGGSLHDRGFRASTPGYSWASPPG